MFRGKLFLIPIFLVLFFNFGMSLIICQNNFEFYDNFGSDSKMWDYLGSAYRDPIRNYVVLTENNPSQAGIIWLRFQFKSNFSISFRFKAGGGTGGDGFVFMFYKQNYSYKDPWSRHLGGMQLGYNVEFDSYNNEIFPIGGIDPSDNHIALTKDGYTKHLIYANDQRIEDYSWHNVDIEVGHSSVIVEVDSNIVFEWIGSLNREFSQVGFAATTGEAANWHIIDDVLIGVDPEPIVDRIIGVEDRIEVGTTCKIGFHTKWNSNNSDAVGGIIYINGTEYVTNGTGWITFQDTSMTSKMKTWNITEVDFGGITTFHQVIPNPSVIWDKIETKYRIDTYTPGVIEIVVNLSFEYDGKSIDEALIEISKKPAKNIGNGEYRVILSGVWTPYNSINIQVRTEDFGKIEWTASVYCIGNIALIFGVILVVVYVFLIRNRSIRSCSRLYSL